MGDKEEDIVASHKLGALDVEDVCTPGLETPLTISNERETTDALNATDLFDIFPKESLPVLDERLMMSWGPFLMVFLPFWLLSLPEDRVDCPDTLFSTLP